jgi:hypothetical protein
MHGAMFVPVVAGSDKTTVSAATGHQEYHPVYMSPGNLTNVSRRAHSNALLPVAFLPIPKSMQGPRLLHAPSLTADERLQPPKNTGKQSSTKYSYASCTMRVWPACLILSSLV